jgi:phosphatidylglycerophosphate synthase
MARPVTDTCPSDTPEPQQYGRPNAIEDASNRYLIHPLSDIAVKVAYRLGLSPNTVSFLGLVCGLLAAFLYYDLPQTAPVIGGFVAMIGWHVLDGADGRLARLTGRSSAFGRIIDGICDHLVFGAVYIALALHLMETGYSANVWWLVVGAGLSHAVQAAGYEERRQKYQRRLKGIARQDTEQEMLRVAGKQSFLATLYDRAQRLVGGRGTALDDVLQDLRSRQPGGQATAAGIAGRTAPMVRAWGLLNANNRTLLIFIFALLGQPAFYFAFELIVLNLVLAVLLVAEWRQEKALAAVARQYG